ncbi:MAG TPA: hypothetical protein VMT24_13745 [Aggregatilineaceae bacterium]|nr:hypothetical protein [Aggregatilineaceae bacterium]
MYNRILSYLPGILLGIVLAAVGIALKWSSAATPVMVIGVIALAWLIYLLTVIARFAWLRRLNRIVRRLKAGEADRVIAELSARRAISSLSFEETLGLAMAYHSVGRTADSELLVQEAQSLLNQAATATKKDISSQAKRDLVLAAHYDAWIAQGHVPMPASARASLRPSSRIL